jgi:hypothetical protein
VDDLDGPSFARIACHRLHRRSECAATELVRHIVLVVHMDACQLHRREVPVDEMIILDRVLPLHSRAERDLIAVSQNARQSFVDAYPLICACESERKCARARAL